MILANPSQGQQMDSIGNMQPCKSGRLSMQAFFHTCLFSYVHPKMLRSADVHSTPFDPT